MRRDYASLYALAATDRRERTSGLCLAMGALVGAEFPACAMAVLLAAETAFPGEQLEWNAVRAKFGLPEL
jgi:hypothetical protein